VRTRTTELHALATGGDLLGATLALLATSVAFAIPVDYVSLYKTRRLIMAARSRRRRFWTLLLIDVALTGCVVGLGLIYLLLAYIPVFLSGGKAIDTFHALVSREGVESTLTLRSFRGRGWYPHGVFFYSLFFPSVWLWFYGIGALTLSRIGWLRDAMKDWLDLEMHPVRGIGVLVMIAESALFAAILALNLVIPRTIGGG